MFVKICGITRLADAEAAIEQGAAAIGFVFWPKSPRYIEASRARKIVGVVPRSVKTVGVFVNQSVDDINEMADLADLSLVQLHGDEGPEFAALLHRPVIKAVSTVGELVNVGGWPEEIMLLVDAHDPVQRGGTGKGANWPAAAQLAKERRVLLAGGLTPENAGEAIAFVRPFGIDVSSGVESAPGIKDHVKLKDLFRVVRTK